MIVALGTKGAGQLVADAKNPRIKIAGAGGEQHDGERFGVDRRPCAIQAGLP